MAFNIETIKDIITLSKMGWSLQDIKEVSELLATSPTVNKDAAPEELKEEAKNKVIEELPTENKQEEDPMTTLKNLAKED